MKDDRRSSWWADRFWWAMAAISVVAVAVRMWYLLILPRVEENLGGVLGDGTYYLEASRALADGAGFINPLHPNQPPDAHHPPLWTSVLALGRLLGLDTAVGLGFLAAGLGLATVILVGVAGRRITSPRAGVFAAALAAVYPGLWIYERNLNAEALAQALIAATIVLAYRYRDQPGLGRALSLAAVMALLILTRSEQLLCVPLILIPLVLTTPDLDWAHRLGRLVAAGCVMVALLSPWTIYNLGRFERPVLLSTGAGATMAFGACDRTFEGDLIGSYDYPGCWPASVRLGGEASVQDAEFRSAALQYTWDHLDAFPRVLLAREGRTWSLFRPSQAAELHSTQTNAGTGLVWAQTLTYWALLPFAISGAVVLRRRRIMLYPLLAFPAIAVTSTAIAFGDIRYRSPAELSIVLLAAVALDQLARRVAGPESDQDPDRVLPSHEANISA